MKYIYLLEYYFFLETYDSNFTTFEKQISYFSLHYISVKILEVESVSFESQWVIFFLL